ncbi:MAG TPA: copper resistance CopC family protein [Candidatus Acidoferrales bacterium]|nr:copper resistance CopC family protein [Candidatus Acidoferrales bacterium]
MRTSRKFKAIALLITLAPCAASLAYAHAYPEEEIPAAGQQVTTPPAEVSIKFDSAIEKLFAKLEVTGADGKNEAVAAPVVSDSGKRLSVKVGALRPGEYSVKWSVVCIDTHHSQGSYTFTVASGGL